MAAERVSRIMAAVPHPELIHPTVPASADRVSYLEDAQSAYSDLRMVHDGANTFRRYRIIPALPRRADTWEYSTPPEIRDQTQNDLVWLIFLAQEGHEPGIYTDTEATAARG